MDRGEPEQRLEGSHRRAPTIEAEGELVQVDLEVGMTNTMVGTDQPGLQVAEDPVDAGQELLGAASVPLGAYQAQGALARGGLAALVPRKPGPRRAHKLDSEVVDFLHRARAADPAVRPSELARRVQARFGRTVHPRSVERALARRGKTRS